jgi:MFS family permease
VAGLGVLAVTLDSAVNIAFPAISRAFDVSVSGIRWVIVVYVLTFAALLLPFGALADRVGHRRVFAVGLAVTAAAFLASGSARTFAGLLAGRAVQGVGAALTFAAAPALVTLAVPPSRRGRALGWLSLAIWGGGGIGPLAGGVLVAGFGWRAVYLGRVPIAAIALGLTPLLRSGPPPRPTAPSPPKDPPLSSGTDRRTFALANALNLLANAALFFVWLLVPYYLVDRRRMDAAPAGLLFGAGALASAVAAPLGGWCADRSRAGWLPPLGLAVEAAGLLLTSRLGDGSSTVTIAVALALGGAGLGLFVVSNMHYVMSALGRTHQGRAGSLVTVMRMAGIVAGATLATWTYGARLDALTAAGAAAPDAAAFTHAFHVAAAIAGAAALLSLVTCRR